MSIRSRLARLEKATPPLPVVDRNEQSAKRMIDLFWDIACATPLTEEEGCRIQAALDETNQTFQRCPYMLWFRALREGWCRLPEMSPAIARDVLLAFIHPAHVYAYSAAMVCNECGMLVPRNMAVCPICGGSEKDRSWAHQSNVRARWLGLDRHLNAPRSAAG
jgi:hypothetical protein